MSTFWSAQLNEQVGELVVADPATSAVPAACRPALTTTPAFTCLSDSTLYITHALTVELAQSFTGTDLVYAYSALMSHEIGHVVQVAVDQPGIQAGSNNSDAQQQKIEQQADCLSGVWAAAEVKSGRLDPTRFVADSYNLIASVSSNPEILTHGTPPVRKAAVVRGLTGGRPQSCALATFS